MPDPHPLARDKLLNDLSSTLSPGPQTAIEPPPPPPPIPDHELFRCVGRGSYGEVWLARSVMGPWRAVKIVYRRSFNHDRPYERELEGIRRFEPVSRTHPSQLNVLHVGRNDTAGCFYYVMELADDVTPVFQPASHEPPAALDSPTGKSALRSAGFPTGESQLPSEPTGKSALRGAGFPTGELKLPSGPTGKSALQPETYTPRTLRSELLQRGRLPFEECLSLGLALATALDHLHRHGLVHRDIKPSNIIFVNGIPKLADIGLVAAAEATLSVVGTEGYLPPEGPGTPQADIFSLGKVLYEMATGRDRQEYPELPTNLIEQPAAERAQLAELNEIIIRACHADLKQRYQTAAELHADLALLQSGQSVSRMRLVERRLRFVARAGALVTGIALLTTTALLYQQHQTREARRLAQANFELAEQKTRLASEKSELADTNARLAEDNRQRVVRLDVANGVRLLDEGDPSGALLWFADALPLITNNPAEAAIHRIRIQQTFDQTPHLLRVMPHDASLACSAFSPDGRVVATGTGDGKLRVWDAESGSLIWGPQAMGSYMNYVRFSRDGQRLFVCSSPHQFASNGSGPMSNFFAVLDAKSGREVFSAAEVLPGMSTNLFWSTFSPDERWLALSQSGSVVRVFDLRGGRPVTELRGHTNQVSFLSFSADGSLLASASADKTVRLWRLPSGEPVGPPLAHRLPVMRAILTDDGQRLLTGSLANPGAAGECEIQAWDVATGRRLGDPIKGRDWIFIFVEPGRSGRFFGRVGGGEDSRTHVWHFDPQNQALPPLEIANSQCWAFSPDGKRLAMGGDDYTARVFSLETGELLAGPFRHNRWVHAVEFSPDGHRLLTASDDGNARLWDLRASLPESAALKVPGAFTLGSPESVNRRGVSPGPIAVPANGWRLISAEGLVEVGQLQVAGEKRGLRGILAGHFGRSWVLHPIGPSENEPQPLYLWRQEGGQFRQFTLNHPCGFDNYTFTPDDRLVLTFGTDHLIRFWRTADGELERTLEAPQTDGYVAEISPDVKFAIWHRPVEYARPVLEWFDLDSGKIVGGPYSLAGPITRVEFSPDGTKLALADPNGPVTVLEGRTGRLISSTVEHTANLLWVDWAPDSRRLLTAGHDEETLVWDATTGAQLLGPLRTPGGITRVARWSPDGRFIVTRNDAHLVRVWDATTGEAVTPLQKHSGEVSFAFMTRSNRLITASKPDLLRAWDLKETPLPPDVLADYAKLLSGRRLNAASVMLPLKPEELAELSRSLRARAPQLFE